jgi:hypothetical protein
VEGRVISQFQPSEQKIKFIKGKEQIHGQDLLGTGQDPARIVDLSPTSQNFFHLTGQCLSMPGRRQRPFRSIQNMHLMGIDCFRPREPMLDGQQDVEVAEGFQLEDFFIITFHNHAYYTALYKRPVYRDRQVDQ